VAAYREAIQAETAAELLRSAGIEAVVLDAHTASVQPLYSYAIGGVKVAVREPDLARARLLLRDLLINLEYGIRPAGRRRGVPRCRVCGSPATEPAPWPPGLLGLLLAVPWVFLGPRRRCRTCGHVGRPAPAWRQASDAPLPPEFERAIAAYEAGLRGRLLAALRRVAAEKDRRADLAVAKIAAGQRRKILAERYEAVREAAVAAVAAGLTSPAEREMLDAQANLGWDEVTALERRPGALTDPGHKVLALLAAEARRRADLAG